MAAPAKSNPGPKDLMNFNAEEDIINQLNF